MKLPHGQSNFKTVATEYYYVDRTQYLEKLEGIANRYLFYLRPRKFGKSLFISMLVHYYGEEWKDQFADLFGKYHVGKHPTPLANKYLVLHFDFSGILTDTKETVFRTFTGAVISDLQRFLTRYKTYFNDSHVAAIEAEKSPAEAMRRFFTILSSAAPGKQVYILIDEYDHFANELIAFHLEDFKEIVSRNGFVRKFYEVMKEETTTGLVGRMFITGVSPVTVDSLTSGFNIGEKISLEPTLHEMMGFTEAETIDLLAQAGVTEAEMPVLIEELRSWYDGYLFNAEAENSLYNPNMVIYFGNIYQRHRKPPPQLLDANIASDYGKIRRMLGVGGEAHSLSILETVLAKGEVQAELTTQYSFENTWLSDDYVSLLFYLGMLTASPEVPVGGGWNFRVPNLVIKNLYYQYLVETLRQRADLEMGMYEDIKQAVIALAKDADVQPFLRLVCTVLERLSNRDAMEFGEKNVKAIFASLLTPSNVYLVRSEPEVQRRYVDLLCVNMPAARVNFNFAFELKYLKKAEAHLLETRKTEARQQLEAYLQTDDLRNVPKLAAFAIVFVGTEAKSVERLA